jgi:hypothetical protein
MNNKYVIIYNNNNDLFDEYQVIEGKTPKEALKKTFGKEFKRLTGDAGRYARIILVKGDYKNNTITPAGRYQTLCFSEV